MLSLIRRGEKTNDVINRNGIDNALMMEGEIIPLFLRTSFPLTDRCI